MNPITAALAAPFPAAEVRWLPQVVRKDGRALAVPYITAGTVLERLNAVLGADGWQDAYDQLPDGCVLCRLRIKAGAEWIERSDVGGPSEQKDAADRRKAAHSDALKRAARKFGIGAYLGRIEGQWVDYDAHRRQLKGTPALPAWALPSPEDRGQRTEDRKSSAGPPAGQKAGNGHAPPRDGAELEARLRAYDTELHRQGLAERGQLVKAVLRALSAQHGNEMVRWGPAAITAACAEAVKFAEARTGPKEKR